MHKRPVKSVHHLLCGLTMPHRRLMRANHQCAVIIRQVRGLCSWAAQLSRLCGHCAVVRSAFSETGAHCAARYGLECNLFRGLK